MSIRGRSSVSWSVQWLGILFVLCIPALATAAPVAPVPQTLVGTWQVTKVNIDTGSARTRNIQYNDPRIKGRLLTVSPDKLTWNMSVRDLCEAPKITHKRMMTTPLIKDSMAGRELPPEIPIPEDYKLPLPDEAPVDVLSVRCKDGLWGGRSRTLRSWRRH